MRWMKRYQATTWMLCVLATSVAAYAEEATASGANGKALFDLHCASCHGMQGHGDGVVSDGSLLRPRDFALDAFKFDTDADWERGTDTDLANVIRNSPSVYGGSPLMPPWAHLSDDEIAALVAYIRELQG
jgi:mono/diheme cytochrome c family protein